MRCVYGYFGAQLSISEYLDRGPFSYCAEACVSRRGSIWVCYAQDIELKTLFPFSTRL